MVDQELLGSTTATNADLNPEHWHNNIFGLEMPVDVISILYASTVALGGVIGFATKGLFLFSNVMQDYSQMSSSLNR